MGTRPRMEKRQRRAAAPVSLFEWFIRLFRRQPVRPPFPTFTSWTMSVIPMQTLHMGDHVLYHGRRYVVPAANALGWARQGLVHLENVPPPISLTR